MKKYIIVLLVIVLLLSFSKTFYAAEIPAWSKADGRYYNDVGAEIKNVLAKGIDVSKWQGEIDWDKVAKTDIEYAIIRCGIGDDMTSQDDSYFFQNIAGCKANNIPYGVYIYSYATDVTHAKSEAKHVLRLLKSSNAKIQYPVYYDIEDDIMGTLTTTQLGDIAEAFCNTISEAGYDVGVYANASWWNSKLTDARFNKWKKWVAQRNSICTYNEHYNMWQAANDGKVDGINGFVDFNFEIKDDCAVVGHGYGAWKTTRQSTCTVQGQKERLCRFCQKVETASITVIRHTEKWSVTKEVTALQAGKKECRCAVCNKLISSKSITKLKATGKVNASKVTIKVKKTYKKLKVTNLAKGDGIKSYKSADKKIVKVNSKGVLTAGKKKGKTTVIITLKSGKKLAVKVTVKK